MLSAHRRKSDEKPFSCQIYVIVLRKNGTCCNLQVFFFILKGLKTFLNPMLSLIAPLSAMLLRLGASSHFTTENLSLIICLASQHNAKL